MTRCLALPMRKALREKLTRVEDPEPDDYPDNEPQLVKPMVSETDKETDTSSIFL